MLYPKMTRSRMIFDLNGIWQFRLLKRGEEYDPSDEEPSAMISMPVPSSYNDIYNGRDFCDFPGDMLYKRTFEITPEMMNKKQLIHFGSVTHTAKVWLNQVYLGCHKGGFLPFEFDVTGIAKTGTNHLSVLVNNVVDYTTLPVGRLVKQKYPGLDEEIHNLPNFDFYNYTGIMRPVSFCILPDNHIEDIIVWGKADGTFSWEVSAKQAGRVRIKVIDPNGKTVFSEYGRSGQSRLEQVQLWDISSPCLYKLSVMYTDRNGIEDVYEEEFGFREVSITGCNVYLNGKPVYLKGFGRHEDSPIHGRGFDLAYNVKDIALMKWIGANSFRTSHYPVCEEMLQLCDKEGILVIDEAPAVGLNTGFTATGLLGGEPKGTWKELQTAEHHRQVLEEMISRDKNHPCVIMWSVANEPASQEEGANEYFQPLIQLVKERDVQKRPVTIVTYEGSSPETCKVAELCDVLILNRYRGWYDTEGNLPAAAALLRDELERFHDRCPDKPIMLGEYGADTISGFHSLDARLFSEEYQEEFLNTYGEVFDSLPYITGEHVWVFADFATAENIKRVDGNKKGIFTRDRKPKMSAYYLKKRWLNK